MSEGTDSDGWETAPLAMYFVALGLTLAAILSMASIDTEGLDFDLMDQLAVRGSAASPWLTSATVMWAAIGIWQPPVGRHRWPGPPTVGPATSAAPTAPMPPSERRPEPERDPRPSPALVGAVREGLPSTAGALHETARADPVDDGRGLEGPRPSTHRRGST